MADRKLGMAHVSDLQLARLAASITRLQRPPARTRPLPVWNVQDRDRHFEVDPGTPLHQAEVYAVVNGERVARLIVLPAGWDCC